MKDIVAHVRQNVQGKTYDSDQELRKAATDVGCWVYPERIKIHGRLQHVILNKAGKLRMEAGFVNDSEANMNLREMIIPVNALLESDM
jgi:hypothetical protein